MIRILVVGCGKIATLGHFPALQQLREDGRVEVFACDIDASRAKAAGDKFGVPWFTEWSAAAGDVDAVSVCLPPGLSSDVARAAVERGLHVLCEKPPGRDLQQASGLAEAASATPDAVTMVGFNRRFNPLYRQALTRSCQLGAPTSFYGRFSQMGLGDPPDDLVDDWITSASSHALDLAVATMGYPSSVRVTRRMLGAGPDNSWTVHMQCQSGAAVLMLHFAAGRRVERYEWAGAAYDVALDLPKKAEWAQSGRSVETWSAGGSGYHDASGFTDQYRCLVGAIEGTGPRPEADFAYAPAFMTLVETILAAPDGAIQEIEVPASSEPRFKGRGAKRPVPAAPSRALPVVAIHQPQSVHHRFFPPQGLSGLREKCDLRVVEAPDDWAALKDVECLVTGRGAKVVFPANVADLLPELRLLVVLGASVRNFGAEALAARGVAVLNTADAVAQSVAEHCLMLALAGLRRLPEIDRRMHAGEWPRPGDGRRTRRGPDTLIRGLPWPVAARRLLGPAYRKVIRRRTTAPGTGRDQGIARPDMASDLRGQTVGLLGWGHTARRFAELLAPFGCSLLVATESAEQADLDAAGARRVSLGEALASKVVSLHRGLTSETRGFLGEIHLDQLRPGSVLVNVARGELVDEEALIRRLARGDIVAALDVFNEEPLPKKHRLRKLPNVILTPHHASTTAQEEPRMGDEAINAILGWIDGHPPTSLEPDRLRHMT